MIAAARPSMPRAGGRRGKEGVELGGERTIPPDELVDGRLKPIVCLDKALGIAGIRALFSQRRLDGGPEPDNSSAVHVVRCLPNVRAALTPNAYPPGWPASSCTVGPRSAHCRI